MIKGAIVSSTWPRQHSARNLPKDAVGDALQTFTVMLSLVDSRKGSHDGRSSCLALCSSCIGGQETPVQLPDVAVPTPPEPVSHTLSACSGFRPSR